MFRHLPNLLLQVSELLSMVIGQVHDLLPHLGFHRLQVLKPLVTIRDMFLIVLESNRMFKASGSCLGERWTPPPIRSGF